MLYRWVLAWSILAANVQAQICSEQPVSVRVSTRTGVSALTEALAAAASCPNTKIKAAWVGAVVLSEPIVIGKGVTLTITGDDVETSIADGGGTTQMFDVDAKAELVLINMTLTNGFTDSSNGGAVSLGKFANLNATGTVFSSNAVRDTLVEGSVVKPGSTIVGYAGAIYGGPNSTINISNSTFVRNTASIAGGAIGSLAAVNIMDSMFINNAACVDTVAEGHGGGAVAYTAFAIISGSRFINNSADSSGLQKGGALCDLAGIGLEGARGDVGEDVIGVTSIDRSIFISNSAFWNAGAAYVNGEVTLTSCQFRGNSAVSSAGAVTLQRGHLNISHCTFAGNTANGDGHAIRTGSAGAIEILSPSPRLYGHTISDSTFINNYCTSTGGALESSFDMDIYASSFSNNTALEGGGALSLSNTASAGVRIRGCKFISNHAAVGGAILNNLKLDLTDVVLANNTANSGGAIHTSGTT
jgi:predicted outer membrane repeat protein